MTVELQKKWHVVFIRPGSERKVTRLLNKKDIETYYPEKNTGTRTIDRRRMTSPAPLFPRYIFVFVSKDDYKTVKQTDGVINFLHWQKDPAIICDEEINTVKNFINEYENVSVEKTQVNIDEEIKIINGPLMMWEGNIVEVKTEQIKITLPKMGYSMIARIRESFIDNHSFTTGTKATAI